MLSGSAVQLQGMKSSFETEKEKRKVIEHELKKLKREALDESQKHEKTKEELMDTSTQLQGMKSSFEKEKKKCTEIEDELNKIKGEAHDESLQHDETKKELLNTSTKLEVTEILLAKEKAKTKEIDNELLETSTKLQGMKSSFETEKEKRKVTEDELKKFKAEAHDESLQHEETKKELLDTLTKLQGMKSLLAIGKGKSKRMQTKLNKIKREARDESQQHAKTKKKLLDTSKKLQGMKNSLEIEKEKSRKIEEELCKIKKEAHDESQQQEKTKDELKNELERQKMLFELESHRNQQAQRDLQGPFFELYKTNSSLQSQIKSLTEELAIKLDELQKLGKLYNGMLNQNRTLEMRQRIIVKDFEKFRQWIEVEEQGSNIHGMSNFAEFSCADLKEATNNFNNELKIGEGGYGRVYKGVLHGTTVAIKVLNEGSLQGEKEFNQEVKTLRKVRHPNLVKLIGACFEKRSLVYEFLPEGSLEDCLRNDEGRTSLPWEKRIQIASNICSGLVFLHHTKPNGIVHADLKPANILLDTSHTCKLIDFGLCRELKLTGTTKTPHHTTKIIGGTFCYFDPEYLETKKITTHNDVFTLGVILLQLVTGGSAEGIRMMVQDALDSKKLDEVMDPSANWPLEVAEKMAQLGLRCIERLKKERPDLANEVCVEIESMEQVASRS